MKKIVFVNGTMGVGKTATCGELRTLLPRNVFLDGDWCWQMRPFVVTDTPSLPRQSTGAMSGVALQKVCEDDRSLLSSHDIPRELALRSALGPVRLPRRAGGVCGYISGVRVDHS